MVPSMLELIFSYIRQKFYQGYDSHFFVRPTVVPQIVPQIVQKPPPKMQFFEEVLALFLEVLLFLPAVIAVT
jgi:hypothetical protein